MQKKALIILAGGFEEIEGITVIDILRRAGIETITAGITDIKVQGSHGITVIADKTLAAIKGDFDVCVLPGGMPGAANLYSSEKVNSILKEMDKNRKIIAAICASPAIVLAPLGILQNKTATCFTGMQKNFGKGVIYKEDNVIIDGNIITSRGPGTAILFALAIVEKLSGKETSEKIRKEILIPGEN